MPSRRNILEYGDYDENGNFTPAYKPEDFKYRLAVGDEIRVYDSEDSLFRAAAHLGIFIGLRPKPVPVPKPPRKRKKKLRTRTSSIRKKSTDEATQRIVFEFTF